MIKCLTAAALGIAMVVLVSISEALPALAQTGPSPSQSLAQGLAPAFTSIKQAKRYGQFVREVHVVPDHFDWEGHRVSVWESWLDREDHITFKLKVDGSEVMEHRLADRRDKNIYFTEYPVWSVLKKKLIDSGGGFGGMGTFSYLPLSHISKSILSGGYGAFVHYFEIVAHPIPKTVQLRLGTYSGYNNEILSDTILTFYLDDPTPESKHAVDHGGSGEKSKHH
jgi:hypothetical protein